MKITTAARPLALLAGLAFSAGAHASYEATTTVDTTASTAINLAFNSFTSDDPPPLTQTSSLATPLVTGQRAYTDQLSVAALNLFGAASGNVTVSPGSIQVLSTASGGTNINPGAGTAYAYLYAVGSSLATGSFTDAVVWQAAGFAPGTPIYLDYSVRFDGAPSVTVSNVFGQGSGGLNYQWQTQVGPGGLMQSGQRFFRVETDGTVSQNSFDSGSFSTTAYVTLGQAANLSMWVTVSASGMGQSQCENCSWEVNGQGESGGISRLTWNGITGARLFDGTPINLSLLQASSDSGFDYTNAAPVPEPSGGLLMVLGLAAVAAVRGRRSRLTAGVT
jgi:hypothetical protein